MLSKKGFIICPKGVFRTSQGKSRTQAGMLQFNKNQQHLSEKWLQLCLNRSYFYGVNQPSISFKKSQNTSIGTQVLPREAYYFRAPNCIEPTLTFWMPPPKKYQLPQTTIPVCQTPQMSRPVSIFPIVLAMPIEMSQTLILTQNILNKMILILEILALVAALATPTSKDEHSEQAALNHLESGSLIKIKPQLNQTQTDKSLTDQKQNHSLKSGVSILLVPQGSKQTQQSPNEGQQSDKPKEGQAKNVTDKTILDNKTLQIPGVNASAQDKPKQDKQSNEGEAKTPAQDKPTQNVSKQKPTEGNTQIPATNKSQQDKPVQNGPNEGQTKAPSQDKPKQNIQKQEQSKEKRKDGEASATDESKKPKLEKGKEDNKTELIHKQQDPSQNEPKEDPFMNKSKEQKKHQEGNASQVKPLQKPKQNLPKEEQTKTVKQQGQVQNEKAKTVKQQGQVLKEQTKTIKEQGQLQKEQVNKPAKVTPEVQEKENGNDQSHIKQDGQSQQNYKQEYSQPSQESPGKETLKDKVEKTADTSKTNKQSKIKQQQKKKGKTQLSKEIQDSDQTSQEQSQSQFPWLWILAIASTAGGGIYIYNQLKREQQYSRPSSGQTQLQMAQ